ncbi:tRNA guanosine-2'-O-methyltransferase TRM13 [Strigomonas culicis]|uniref:tRNA:m(4)X modification enzyme TRM13 n=1 Tax=Strigomonas culicis TaxID=28005 RepID=S9U2S1_9TRYP|nr:tRNA guanosine-2'-O-methyltransferase TRM13 [Strigomonas culicis]|eukprot:EPY23233.1 tRNA guanosine-2'-O-methyltransferase TRM13 [Strigomonas culicis]
MSTVESEPVPDDLHTNEASVEKRKIKGTKKGSLFVPSDDYYRCSLKQYNSVQWSLMMLAPFITRLRPCEDLFAPTDTAASGFAARVAQLLDGLVGCSDTAEYEGPLSAQHVRSLAHLAPGDIRQLFAGAVEARGHHHAAGVTPADRCCHLFPTPSEVLRTLWDATTEQRYTECLLDAHKHKIKYYRELSTEGCLCEAGLYAHEVFGPPPGVRGTALQERWAALIDQYSLYLPDRSHLHELENLPQEVAIGELLARCVADVRQRQPDFSLQCVVDVGGGNGFLAAAAAERLGCDSVVIDPFFPAHAVDCAPRPWPDTTVRVRAAVPRRRALRRSIAFFKDTEWAADVGSAPDRTAFVAKHLCGSAIDECLRHLEAQGCLPRILILAPCCFHKGTYAEYISHAYLHEVPQVFSELGYQNMTRLSDWNQSTYRDVHKAVNAGRRSACRNLFYLVPCADELAATVEALLNYGRGQWLEAHGYTVSRVEYVPRCVTPKNKCIVAVRMQ